MIVERIYLRNQKPEIQDIKNAPYMKMFKDIGRDGNIDAMNILLEVYERQIELLERAMRVMFTEAGKNARFDIIDLIIKNKYVKGTLENVKYPSKEPQVSLYQIVGYTVHPINTLKDDYSIEEIEKAIARNKEWKKAIEDDYFLKIFDRKINWQRARSIFHVTGPFFNYEMSRISDVKTILVKSIASGDINIFNLALDMISINDSSKEFLKDAILEIDRTNQILRESEEEPIDEKRAVYIKFNEFVNKIIEDDELTYDSEISDDN